MVQNTLTKQQYINIRLESKRRNCDIYPPYEYIVNAKKECYPDNLHVSETNCFIPIQDLFNHTTHRIFKISGVPKVIEMQMKKFEIIYKWGCDGSNGQSQYKVKLSTSTSDSDCSFYVLFSTITATWI
ncbi:uncharacterized protein LOC112692072 [Sipha flava]|uniref:Uncharacterized protein LOC112692072 n=1 Tax=Sipha flava TaxID=143950 RepID=A0A8B8GGM9_9HEMI|nr:uncharacterized protein LOC112692072 [Sipha flava]